VRCPRASARPGWRCCRASRPRRSRRSRRRRRPTACLAEWQSSSSGAIAGPHAGPRRRARRAREARPIAAPSNAGSRPRSRLRSRILRAGSRTTTPSGPRTAGAAGPVSTARPAAFNDEADLRDIVLHERRELRRRRAGAKARSCAALGCSEGVPAGGPPHRPRTGFWHWMGPVHGCLIAYRPWKLLTPPGWRPLSPAWPRATPRLPVDLAPSHDRIGRLEHQVFRELILAVAGVEPRHDEAVVHGPCLPLAGARQRVAAERRDVRGAEGRAGAGVARARVPGILGDHGRALVRVEVLSSVRSKSAA
jgi:hypothetical protein